MKFKYNSTDLFVDAYNYKEWIKKEGDESTDIPPMPIIESDEEVKEGEGL